MSGSRRIKHKVWSWLTRIWLIITTPKEKRVRYLEGVDNDSS